MTFDLKRQVLVIGAGPCGLAVALGLAQRGVPVRVVDRAGMGANTSRAAVVHPATLEALEAVQAAEPLLARALRVSDFWVRDRNRTLAEISFAGLPTSYPFTAMVPQSQTEEVLRDLLGVQGVEVEWDTELVGLEQDDQGVRATLLTAQAEHDAEASVVIGADGGHSRTRELVGIDFPGAAYEQDFVLADVRMDWPVGRETVSLTFAPAGLVVVAPLPGDRYRIVATADAPPEEPSLDDVQTLVRERAGAGAVDEVVHSGRFRVSHRLAARYRSGRVFLLGDAAHVHSPAGGQGMNTGIRDALVLAEVLATGADVDDYQRLRRPVAQSVIRLTDRMTRAATATTPVLRAGRNALLGGVGSLAPARKEIAMRLSGLQRP